jgi:hypothetical protein
MKMKKRMMRINLRNSLMLEDISILNAKKCSKSYRKKIKKHS